MAAPTTKLLFLFLLGITSWSRYVAATEVKLIECAVDIFDKKDVLDSVECIVVDNKFMSTVRTKDCPNQISVELQKNDVVVSSGGESFQAPIGENATFCQYHDVTNSRCQMGEGIYEFDCNIEEFGVDFPPGSYEIKQVLKINESPAANLIGKVAVQSV